MFRILQIFTVVLVFSSLSTSNGCEITLQPDLNGGCTFDQIHLLHPSMGVELAPICGTGEIDIEFLQEQPIVIYPEAVDSLKYSLVMVDKIWDGSVFLQWLVTDVNGSWLKRGIDMTDGKTIAAYMPPPLLTSDPPSPDCSHRFSIYVFEQSTSPLALQQDDGIFTASRADFQFFDFINPENGFCGPVAGHELESDLDE